MRIRRLAQAVLTVALSIAGISAYGADEPYKIGMLSSFSGYVANMGLGGRDGLMLAVDEINKRGGVNGRMIKIIPLNDESDATKEFPWPSVCSREKRSWPWSGRCEAISSRPWLR